MRAESLQNEYLERISSKLQKLTLEVDVFQTRANKAVGLAKAKYLEQMKNVQEKRDLLNKFIKRIIEGGNQLDKAEFRRKIDSLIREIDETTEEEKQRLIDLFR
jgi:uncharacterized protein YoxC